LNQAKTQAMASVSLTGEFLLIRYLGDSSEQAKQLFLHCWQKIRPLLLNRDACIPRIWAT
jgi:urease accessory protein